MGIDQMPNFKTLKMYPPKRTILNIDFAFKLRIYRDLISLK